MTALASTWLRVRWWLGLVPTAQPCALHAADVNGPVCGCGWHRDEHPGAQRTVR